MEKKQSKLSTKKAKNWILFSNGIKVILPKGWRLGENFEIRGIERDLSTLSTKL